MVCWKIFIASIFLKSVLVSWNRRASACIIFEFVSISWSLGCDGVSMLRPLTFPDTILKMCSCFESGRFPHPVSKLVSFCWLLGVSGFSVLIQDVRIVCLFGVRSILGFFLFLLSVFRSAWLLWLLKTASHPLGVREWVGFSFHLFDI